MARRKRRRDERIVIPARAIATVDYSSSRASRRKRASLFGRRAIGTDEARVARAFPASTRTVNESPRTSSCPGAFFSSSPCPSRPRFFPRVAQRREEILGVVVCEIRRPPRQPKQRCLLPDPHRQRHAFPVHRASLFVAPVRFEMMRAHVPVRLARSRRAPTPEARAFALARKFRPESSKRGAILARRRRRESTRRDAGEVQQGHLHARRHRLAIVRRVEIILRRATLGVRVGAVVACGGRTENVAGTRGGEKREPGRREKGARC